MRELESAMCRVLGGSGLHQYSMGEAKAAEMAGRERRVGSLEMR